MTAVPKPLKFLRPHYENFEKAYESWPTGDDKVRVAVAGTQEPLLTAAEILCRYAVCSRHDVFG